MDPEPDEQRPRKFSTQARLEEYKSLRDEIGRNSQLTTNVFLASVTATGVFFGFGFETKNGAIFLSPFAILIPSLFFVSSQLESTTRIASYIKMVLEPGLGLGWESDWWDVRQRSLLPRRRKYTLSISWLYVALSVSCLMLAFFYWEAASLWKLGLIALPLAVLVGLGVCSLNGAFSRSHVEDYELAWSRLGIAREETGSLQADEERR